MSLTVAFNSARLGLNLAEKKIAVTASNINNADRAGYTRKVFQSAYFHNGLASYPSSGTVAHANVNPILTKQVVQSATSAQYHSTLATYLSTYNQAFGSTAEDSNTLSNNMNSLTSSLQILEHNSSDAAAKSKVVASAQEIANTLNTLSQALQTQRLSANNDIVNSITTINENLKSIYELNRMITADGVGEGVADLEDDRNLALKNLSEQLGIQYFINEQNQALVYSSGGNALVSGTNFAVLEYSSAGVVGAGTVYPAGFSGIMLNGVDITPSVHTGKLGALVKLRDDTLPAEQAKLDVYADTLMRTVNSALSQGSAYPPLSTITGTTPVTAATPFSATGSMRVAVTDSTGVVVNYTDLDLSTVSPATVGGLVSALNGISGVSASINADGYLEVSSTSSANRVSINPLNSSVSGGNASQFFGFNNLFTLAPGAVSSASSLQVNNNLMRNYGALAIGKLNDSPTLAAGQNGVTGGDASVATQLINALKAPQSFASAGNFSARNSTLANYAAAIMTDSATQASAADSYASTAAATHDYLANALASESGVNVNEETANLTILQTTYQANAQVISTVRDLFQSLMSAIQ